ncbi:hypothetical protein PFISCL1PPCAC_26664, partial [Pristionchus fissidentatus]
VFIVSALQGTPTMSFLSADCPDNKEDLEFEDSQPSSSTPPTHGDHCVVCEELLAPGLFFPLPINYPELKRWALGLFPTKQEEFELFIEHIRLLDANRIPVVCINHFARLDVVDEPGSPIHLRPCAIPVKYAGSMKARMDSVWQRRKCIVCGAMKPCGEMFPFTQKNPMVSVWCKSLFPNDKKAASRQYSKVMRSVVPALCGDHFDFNCFDFDRNLRPQSIPTLAKIHASSNVMYLLSRAKADLNKVLPGNFIPRHKEWSQVEKAAGYTHNTFKPTKPKQWAEIPKQVSRKQSETSLKNDPFICQNMHGDGIKTTSSFPIEEPLAGNLFDAVKKEEPLDDLMDDDQEMIWTPSEDPTSIPVEDLEDLIDRSPSKEKRKYTKRVPTSVIAAPTIRKSARGKAKKAYSPPPPAHNYSTRKRSGAVEAEVVVASPIAVEPVVTTVTRSGRQVKPKAAEFEMERKRRKVKKVKAASSSLDDSVELNPPPPLPGTIDPITYEIYEEPEEVKPDVAAMYAADRVAAAAAQKPSSSAAACSRPAKPAATAAPRPRAAPAAKKSDIPKPGEVKVKKTRSRPFKLIIPRIKCKVCNENAEATLYGMKEHAREHSENSLRCPFDRCDYSATKRAKISHHTKNFHNNWALAVDICDYDPQLEKSIEETMHKCFPDAMTRTTEPGSVPCSICSLVVSPKYRDLYSHACVHLPSRSYLCSACAIDAYTEESIEEHLVYAACGGEVVSNMDDATSSLVQKLFKTAFPTYAHLMDDNYPTQVGFDEHAVAPFQTPAQPHFSGQGT